jgi:hypothetical protein
VRASFLVGVAASGFVVLGAGTAAAQSAAEMTPLEVSVACGAPVLSDDGTKHALHIIGGQDTVARTTFGNRDLLTIDGGTAAGVQLGQEYYVRGMSRIAPMPYQGGAQQSLRTAGWVRIVAANERTSIAQVIRSCGAMLNGDYLEAFKPPSVPAGADRDEATGDPDFSALGHIVSGPEDRRTAALGDFILIDRGSDQGVTPGARFAAYRDIEVPGMPLAPIGEIVVVDVGKSQSLARITRSRDALQTGDYVAPRK